MEWRNPAGGESRGVSCGERHWAEYVGRDTHQDPHLHFNPASSLREMGSDEPVSGSRGGDVHKGGVLHSTAQCDAYVIGRTDSRICRKMSPQWINYRRGSVAKVPVRETRMQINRGM